MNTRWWCFEHCTVPNKKIYCVVEHWSYERMWRRWGEWHDCDFSGLFFLRIGSRSSRFNRVRSLCPLVPAFVSDEQRARSYHSVICYELLLALRAKQKAGRHCCFPRRKSLFDHGRTKVTRLTILKEMIIHDRMCRHAPSRKRIIRKV